MKVQKYLYLDKFNRHKIFSLSNMKIVNFIQNIFLIKHNLGDNLHGLKHIKHIKQNIYTFLFECLVHFSKLLNSITLQKHVNYKFCWIFLCIYIFITFVYQLSINISKKIKKELHIFKIIYVCLFINWKDINETPYDK